MLFQSQQIGGGNGVAAILIGIGAIASPIMIFALGILNYRSNRQAEKDRKDAATAVKEVAVVAEKATTQAKEQSDKILILADKTHTLVNSQYGIALALIVEKATRIYEISKLETDREDLEKAREKLAEHEAKQHTVDTKESTS